MDKMPNILQAIKVFFVKRKFKKYNLEIRVHLNKLNTYEQSLILDCENLKKQKNIISDEQLNQIKVKYKNKLENYNTFYSVNNTVIAFITKEQSILSSDRGFLQLEKEYDQLLSNINNQLQLLPHIKDEVNSKLEHHFKTSYEFIKTVNLLRKNYITHSMYHEIQIDSRFKNSFDYLKNDINEINDKTVKEFIIYFGNLSKYINKWNNEYVNNELRIHKDLFNNIDGKSLDIQQRTAIVTDEDANLILAGAGSGKTLTISGKVKYLIDRKGVNPDEILLISFTKKASEEMKERISKKLGLNVDVMTFHKLGLQIISTSNGFKPEVFDELDKVIDNYFKTQIISDNSLLQLLLQFFGFYINIPKDLDEFEDLGEYHEHYKNVDFETLKSKAFKQKEYVKKNTKKLANEYKTYSGEQVKSLEEFIIANFLFLNGIDYIYESPYAYNTANQNYRQYKPDFYLPEYDIYIEHFGINENFRAPHLSDIEEKIYLEGIEWKRNTHKQYQTTLIETYSYYNKNGILLEKLEEKLKNYNIVFNPVDFKELYSAIYDQTNDRYFTEFKKLIATFINLFKSNGFRANKFREFKNDNNRTKNHIFLQKRNHIFFSLVEPIYDFYQKQMQQSRQIDFNDMIITATNLIKNDKISFNYKYIIIDEYQDISHSRYNLVNEIRQKTKAKIMCVGDDWQSIYRFAGSDVQLFTKFRDYFGQHELLKIEKTYRNSQQLIDIAGKFVMKNPLQYKKDLKSDKSNPFPIRLFGYKGNEIILSLTKAIEEVINLYGEDTEVLLLGRNNFDIKILDNQEQFKINNKNMTIKYNKYPKLKITFLTVHRSKGLESDNVILINAKNSTVGFPNKISDDPILSYVLTDSDDFWFAEERRLFYVAITRTKNTTYVLVPEHFQSTFVKELRNDYKLPYEYDGQNMITNLSCPRCKSGHLLVRANGMGQKFLGCSNYPGCDYTLNNIEVLNDQIKCISCGRYMVRRKNRYGKAFYGCSYYPKCNNTLNIE